MVPYANEIRKNNESDTSFKSGSVYLELGGQGIGLSANADYRFHPNLTFRAGLSYLIFGYGMPLSLNYITGKNSSHHLELGSGITYIEIASFSLFGYSTEPVRSVIPTATLGYRYQPQNGGFVFRISFTPLFLIVKEESINRERGTVESHHRIKINPWGGISLGYCFK
jgi:hypothetical protein